MQTDVRYLVPSLGQEDPLEKEMATHSSILVWRIPWREELSRLQSIELHRIGPKLKQPSTQVSLFHLI